MNNLPKISLVLITFNGGFDVERCLESVRKQIYPKDKLEIIVIDNGSTDDTVKLAKKYTNKVFVRKVMDGGYSNRAAGMRKATGEFIYMILEQDMELRGRYFLQKMIRPLIENKDIVASFTREYPRSDQPWVTRFISYHPVQCDPLFEFLTPSIKSTIIKKEKGYFLCRYTVGKIPPTTHMLFRKSYLKKTPVWKQKKDFDHDTILRLVNSGYNLFAYIPSAGDYHHHAKDLKELIGKRIRNLKHHYFPEQDSLKYKWLDENNKLNLVRLIFWVIYVNLFIPELIRGIIRFLKYHDWVLFMQPIISIVTTDAILFYFLVNNSGRKIIFNLFRKMFA